VSDGEYLSLVHLLYLYLLFYSLGFSYFSLYLYLYFVCWVFLYAYFIFLPLMFLLVLVARDTRIDILVYCLLVCLSFLPVPLWAVTGRLLHAFRWFSSVVFRLYAEPSS